VLFLNISSDKVHISDVKKEIFLERYWIENILWAKLIDRYKKNPFTEDFLLNWPWGFTTLRVGTLCINLLTKLLDYKKSPKIKIYDISKIDLYKYLYKKNILPRYGIIYIWQKRNIWKYDFKYDKYEVLVNQNLGSVSDLFFDFLSDSDYREETKNMLSLKMTTKWLQILFKKKSFWIDIVDLELKPKFQVKPQYLIEAVK
jgi:hypothetical protein